MKTDATREPALRIWHSGNPNHSSKWYYFALRGVASGSCTLAAIPLLVAAVLSKGVP